MNKIIENMMGRRSVREYKEEQINQEELDAILLAGSYAPSGMNMQSWKFTAIQNKEMRSRVNQTIRKTLLTIPVVDETHPYVASLIKKAEMEDAEFLYHAPTYVIVSNLPDNGNSMADSALAIGNMMLAAHSIGVASCWLNQLPGLTDMPEIKALLKELEIPEDHKVFGSFVLGYAKKDLPLAPPRKKGVINKIV